MYTLLAVALLLALLFDTAAATSPTMDPTLSATSIEPFYPDPDGILGTFCHLCGYSLDFCAHVLTDPPQRPPTFTPATFYDHPEWPQELPVFDDPEPELTFPLHYFPDGDRQPLVDANVRQLDDNATTVQPSTVQSHVEDTYNPGDRLEAVSRAGSRRPLHRRQPPRPGGFPCVSDGCGKTFDRSCDLKRHQKTHLGRNERPHKCSVCKEGFLYPKDRNRHEHTHELSPSAQATLYCPVPGCSNVDGFSRRDNLLRHQRKQHQRPVVGS